MKRILLICLAVFFLLPSMASAHSKVSESTPAKDETLTASPAEISLTFNTGIEKLSQFKLLDESGEQIPTGDISVKNSTMNGAVTEPLKNGVYTVKWTIIGADGHAVDGEYAFTVKAAEESPVESASPSPTAEVTEAPDAGVSPDVSEEPAPAASAEDTAADTDTTASENQPVNTMIWIIAGAVVIAAVVILARRNRK
ncbi:copper resistance protein CopC [Paenibacillus glycanilyticus]|uniref:copper resistance CopC family protein n=1 Tax=Paenibacillus glycanilyticus TaxID=126569 RepID=UPI002041034F|nr:copper resistance protein CopC [Paenibacillus glycanilyticus]MCM3630146.1 copper resistance protein CopC [Paenibacillus glycanilyticus]